MNEMFTKTGIMVSASDINRYPRPAMVRSSFLSLNGKWNICIFDSNGKMRREGTITVPFSVESQLGGFRDKCLPGEKIVYQKSFQMNKTFVKEQVILHFEAIDYEAKIFLNDQLVGEHRGAYCDFSFDVRHLLKEDNVLRVEVYDPTDQGLQERGKQSLNPKGIWYHPTSGIYAPVWLEALSSHHIVDYQVTTNLKKETITFHLQNSKPKFHYTLTIYEDNSPVLVKEINEAKTEISFPDGKVWSPENPVIYTFRLYNETDEITGYFGYREISSGPGHQDRPVVYLNQHPYFLNGILDQGYWPESGLTPPSQAALRQDILLAKRFGFNTIRKHIKIEDPYFYYLCDLLGMLVIQDMPSGGAYHFGMMSLAPTIGLGHRNDQKYKAFGRQEKTNRDEFIEMVKHNINKLAKHPSIAVWTIFNEGWGQFDSVALTAIVKKWDSSRLIDSTSGWFDRKAGDFLSIHRYFRKLKEPKKDPRIYMISECGGYSLALDFHRFNEEKEFGYKKFKTISELETAFTKLYREQVMPLFLSGLAGVIYTQLYDVEEETNGLATYDRKIEKMHSGPISEIISKIHY